MYQYHHQPAGTSSCYGEVTGGGGDAILPSPARPDAMLADGGAAFLQSPLPLPPSSYMLPPHCPSPLLVPPPPVPMSMWQSDEQQISRVAAPVRYSAEERRERIDKYRSKRNQRNFQKKITYACRKTLADSRPRVKGRFARNAGDYTDADAAVDHVGQPAEIEVPSPASPEWWPPAVQLQDLPAGIDPADEEMLAAYLGVSSITIDDHQYSCQP
ncbi:Zinc finger protein CONSTANS-LIKE 4 [Zea mays]|uniref:Zinc finger protein CONSTANS-LIKE 4 n=1 Tax=Zea mays TaxID=4577 RepID=A0A3L6FHK3_MAIZE|nr:Zinc finger protein CONSTANS-LIKE 4 [Zea mays]